MSTFMKPISDEVNNVLNEFINRESIYIYSDKEVRDLFTLKQKEEWLYGNMSIDEYIVKHNLREISKEKKTQQEKEFIEKKEYEHKKQIDKELYYDELEANGYFDNYEYYDSDYVESDSEEENYYDESNSDTDSDL